MNNVRTICLAALLIAFFAGIAGQVPAAYTVTNIEVFVANVTPNPVEPGTDLLLNIILKNTGDRDAAGANATLNAAYPFAVKTVQNGVTGKNVCSGCANSIIYALSVDSSAKSGSYPVEFEVSYGSGASRIIEKKAVNIDVMGYPRITFTAEAPGKVTPKSRFSADFQFTNIGTGKAKDIKVSTSSTDFVISGGVPVIDSLSAGESKKITVNFITSPGLAPDVYSIPVSLNYIDERGNSKDSVSNFGVSVLGNSDLAVKSVKIEPMPVSLGSDFTVTVRVQNIGYGDAKEVVMELDAPYSGYKKAFIGKLGKDEDAPAIFNLRADSGTSNAQLAIKYRDDFGEQEKTENIAINILNTSGNLAYYALAVVAVLLAFVYRKRISKAPGG